VKRLASLIASLVLLSMPATASAKGAIEGAQACGSDGCAAVSLPTEHGGAMGYPDLFRHPVESLADPPPGPYYELRLESDLATETFFVSPDASAIHIETGFGSWVRTSDALAARIREATGGLSTYRFQLNEVTVDGRRVAGPASYAGLLSLPAGTISSSEADKHAADWVRLDLSSARVTPWTPGPVTVMYDPELRAVSTGSTRWSALSAPMADRIEAAAGIAASREGSSLPSMWVLAAVAVFPGILAIGSAELIRRSRGGVRREARP
jgi:hypothetical protein